MRAFLFLILAFPGALFANQGGFGNELIYYIMVDRGWDGDPSNNIPNLDLNERSNKSAILRQLRSGSYDPSRRFYGLRFGGDLRGIVNRLDYLCSLGVTTLILSPIFEGAPGWLELEENNFALVTGEPSDQIFRDRPEAHRMTGYHGYWIKDLFHLDPHFGTEADLAELLDEAIKQCDLKVLLDLPLNHSSPVPEVSGLKGYFPEFGALYKNGNRIAAAYDPSLNQWNPSGWFHPILRIDYAWERRNPAMIETGMVGGAADIDQASDEAKQYLIHASLHWLRFNRGGAQIAGFRLDAVKHIPLQFWRQFERELIREFPHVQLVGEYFSGGLRNARSVEWFSSLSETTIFDFNLAESARRFFFHERHWTGQKKVLLQAAVPIERNPDRSVLRSFFFGHEPARPLDITEQAMLEIDETEESGMVSFLENHDFPRLRSHFPQYSETRYANALRFLFAVRGVPMLLYGMETALSIPFHPRNRGTFGIGGDPFNRPMMIEPGSEGWNEPLVDLTRSLIRLRKAYPMLRYGRSNVVTQRGDTFVLRRFDDRAEVLFIYAADSDGVEFPARLIRGKTLVEWEGPNLYGAVNGTFKIPLPADQTIILVSPNFRRDGLPSRTEPARQSGLPHE